MHSSPLDLDCKALFAKVLHALGFKLGYSSFDGAGCKFFRFIDAKSLHVMMPMINYG